LVRGFGPTAGDVAISFQGPGNLEVKDSTIRDVLTGIRVIPAASMVLATLDHVQLQGNDLGLYIVGSSKVTVRNSMITGNGTGSGNGVVVLPAAGAAVDLTLEDSVVSNNAANGIAGNSTSGALATVRVSNSTITDNGVGIRNLGGGLEVLLRGNNTIEGNSIQYFGAIGAYFAK
jgi:nitrous oxidase accessory protein NosD